MARKTVSPAPSRSRFSSILLLLLASGIWAVSATAADVSGTIMQMDNVSGLFVPVGDNLIAIRPLFLTSYIDDGANGIAGNFIAHEHVIRIAAEGDQSPQFIMRAMQTFSGTVTIDGVDYVGTFTMLSYASGPLNPDLALDDSSQGAQSFDGAWVIVGMGSVVQSWTKDKSTLTGSGSMAWDGATFPTYTGDMSLNAENPAQMSAEMSDLEDQYMTLFNAALETIDLEAQDAETLEQLFSDLYDDPPAAEAGVVQFSSASYSVGEADGQVTVTVSRTGGSQGVVSVDYAAGTGGTAEEGDDYTVTSGTLYWADGDSSDKTFTVAIIDDTADEGAETAPLILMNPQGTTLGAPAAIALITIVDNDSTSSDGGDDSNGGCFINSLFQRDR